MNMAVTIRAEQMLRKYYTPDPEKTTAMCLLFLMDICNWKPSGAHQIFYIDSALHQQNICLKAPPRAGKTMGIEGADLYETVMYPNEDLRIYAPKLGQCVETLSYHYDWISASAILRSYLRRKNGKQILSSINYQFVNGSNAMCYSIRGEMEGHNMSIARVEEFDDWEWEKFADDMPRRWGAASKNERGKRVRITGTIRGMENFYRIDTDPDLKKMFTDLSIHPALGILDIYAMLAMGGIMDEDAVARQKALMSPDEWARSMLLKYTEARNFIWQKYLRAGIKKSNQWGLEGVPFVKGGKYQKPVGATVAVGFDCGHGGQKKTSSVYSATFTEEINTGGKRYERWLNCFNWDPRTPPNVIEEEFCELCRFYGVDGGYGDALQMNMIFNINRRLHAMGITDINPDDFPMHTPGNWEKWFISPVWNNDAHKHEMYTAIQLGVHQFYFFIPYYDAKDDCHEAKMVRALYAQLCGIRQTATSGNYPSYHCESQAVGDDDTDSLGMSMMWQNKHSSGAIDYTIAKATGKGRVMTASSMLGRILKGI